MRLLFLGAQVIKHMLRLRSPVSHDRKEKLQPLKKTGIYFISPLVRKFCSLTMQPALTRPMSSPKSTE